MLINIISAIVLLLMFVGGFKIGMGGVLKLCSSGIFGLVITVFLAFMFGGLIRGIPQVHQLMTDIEKALGDKFEFLKSFRLELIIFYVIFFLAFLIARIALISFFKAQDNSGIWLLSTTSKLLGAALCVIFFVGLVLVFFAVIKYFENKKFAVDLVKSLGDSALRWLYLHNPIKF